MTYWFVQCVEQRFTCVTRPRGHESDTNIHMYIASRGRFQDDIVDSTTTVATYKYYTARVHVQFF